MDRCKRRSCRFLALHLSLESTAALGRSGRLRTGARDADPRHPQKKKTRSIGGSFQHEKRTKNQNHQFHRAVCRLPCGRYSPCSDKQSLQVRSAAVSHRCNHRDHRTEKTRSTKPMTINRATRQQAFSLAQENQKDKKQWRWIN